jgi:hypothetical protein
MHKHQDACGGRLMTQVCVAQFGAAGWPSLRMPADLLSELDALLWVKEEFWPPLRRLRPTPTASRRGWARFTLIDAGHGAQQVRTLGRQSLKGSGA